MFSPVFMMSVIVEYYAANLFYSLPAGKHLCFFLRWVCWMTGFLSLDRGRPARHAARDGRATSDIWAGRE